MPYSWNNNFYAKSTFSDAIFSSTYAVQNKCVCLYICMRVYICVCKVYIGVCMFVYMCI